LTAFALRILGQVNQYIDLDQKSVCDSLLWLIDNCQMPDGSFNEFSNYQPVKLQGTLPQEAKENSLYLTAFSIIGIDKSIKICPTQKIHDAKSRAGHYLMQKVQLAQSPFTLAITSYALALVDLNHPSARAAFSALKKEAFVIGTAQSSLLPTSAGPVSCSAHICARGCPTAAKFRNISPEKRQLANYLCPPPPASGKKINFLPRRKDTINALEALTEYSLLVKRLNLDMDVRVSYKNGGPINLFKLTEDTFVGRTVTAPLQDDLYVSTGSSTGIATVNVRTVYNTIGTSEESCNFELKIVPKRDDGRPKQDGEPLGRLEACAKYKPSAREPRSGSAHAVMDIGLVSGVEANPEDLSTASIQEFGVDQLIADYEIKDGRVLLQIDSVPAHKFLCVGFRISELFRVGMLNPATFTVYEYHAPGMCSRCSH
ncbi:CO5 protein, partial [Mystacornis crossleyi]|nr:CO5 protein [Mystacornis crossleyi]